MKKKILGLALVSMSLITFTAVAQPPSGSNPAPKQENVKGKKAERQARLNPFDELNLTDTQKAKLQELNEKCRAERQQQMKMQKEEAKKEAQARKADKQRNDSMRIAERKAAKKKYLDEVKAIIGQDKYVAYLENMYINGGNKMRHDKESMNKGKNFKNKNAARDKGKRPANNASAKAGKTAKPAPAKS